MCRIATSYDGSVVILLLSAGNDVFVSSSYSIIPVLLASYRLYYRCSLFIAIVLPLVAVSSDNKCDDDTYHYTDYTTGHCCNDCYQSSR